MPSEEGPYPAHNRVLNPSLVRPGRMTSLYSLWRSLPYKLIIEIELGVKFITLLVSIYVATNYFDVFLL